MDLRPDQHFVYAWRYTDDTACKLGVSTARTFYARIKAAKTVTHQEIELLGIEIFSTEAAARTAYQQHLKTFQRVDGRRAWVHLTDAVYQWVKTACLSKPPTLDTFKELFQNDPVRREQEREYQRKSSEKRAMKRRQKRTGRTEKQRAYEREYQRNRRKNDPAYKEKQKQRQQAWRAKNPDYDKNRYANDPAYAEARKAARRKKYAGDPAYREQQKERWNAWKKENPNYRRRKAAYMREWRKKHPDYDKNRYRAKKVSEAKGDPDT